MDYEVLFQPGGQGLYVLGLDSSPLFDLIIAWTAAYPSTTIRRIRGDRALNDDAFFNEIGAALQMPYYFSESWIHFSVLMNEFDWETTSGDLLIFDQADVLLRDSPSGFAELLKLLQYATTDWANRPSPVESPSGKVTFQSVFACSPDAVPDLIRRIQATGYPFSILKGR